MRQRIQTPIRQARACSRTRSSGFSLIELVAVLVLISILSVSATPALRWMEDARHASLAKEVNRRLLFTRAYATSTGLPAGLEFDLTTQTIRMMRIAGAGAAPTPIPSETNADAAESSKRIAAISPGASIESIDLSDGESFTTLWFDFEGTPHFRADDGTFAANASRSAVVTISGGRTLTIHPVSGLVEQ